MPDDLATALDHPIGQQALGEGGVQAQGQGDALVDRLLCGDVFFGGNRHVSRRLAELPFRPLPICGRPLQRKSEFGSF